MISVVIPALNAARHLPHALAPLVDGALSGVIKEVIVVDGGSDDATTAIADAAGCRVLAAPRGRGPQLSAGAEAARGDWFLFLHADTALAPGWIEAATRFIGREDALGRAAAFTFAFDDDSRPARRAAFWVRVRCAVLALPYGDQGLLISRAFYDALGGFRPLALMEDVDLVRRIGRRRLTILPAQALTSAEKYLRDGYMRRSLRNLWLLARYYTGADPADLARVYD